MNKKTKQNKGKPKRLPFDRLQKLQIENDRRLNRFAQLQLAVQYYDNYKQALVNNEEAGM